MVRKIPRDICLIKYRKLPLCEYDKELDEHIFYYPETNSSYWLKIENNSQKKSSKIMTKEICSLIENLGIDNLIFFGSINKPWVSKYTEKRKDFKSLIKTIDYFQKYKIAKRFNGGLKVSLEQLEKFLDHFYMLTMCDSEFWDFNFIDEKENYIFHLHYSGEFKILTLNSASNNKLLIEIKNTKFVDSMRENTNRIK